MGGWLLVYEVITMQKMTLREKLIFIASFLWMLHWGTNLTSTILDMVILRNGVRVLPLGL